MKASKKDLLIHIFLSLFICLLSAKAEDRRQIGELSKSKYLYCKFESKKNKFILSNTTNTGVLIKDSILKNKQLLKYITQQNRIINNKKAKPSAKENAKNILKNINLCKRNRFSFPATSLPANNTIINNEEIPVAENQKVEAEATVQSKIQDLQGSCELNATHIKPFGTDKNSPLLAPQSGSLRCHVTGNLTQAFIITVLSRKSQNPEFLFSEKIIPEQLTDGTFYIPLCTEFPGCYRANKVIAAIAESGIQVQIKAVEN